MRLFVEQLTVIDSAFLDSERGLVGESWIVDLELGGRLDEQGMMMDFAHVKKRIKQQIDGTLDHKLLIPALAPGLKHTATEGHTAQEFTYSGGMLRHEAPESAVTVLPAEGVTLDALRHAVEAEVRRVLPPNVTEVTVTLRHERVDGPYYHYVHGLKKHDGNCQRIAHGHRSRIVIERNGMRDHTLEAEWAERFRDIYIATAEDVAKTENGFHHFAYRGDQGEFRLMLPESRCYMLDTDSTVEWIAHHIATQNKMRHPADGITVRAYEGVQKGAIARA